MSDRAHLLYYIGGPMDLTKSVREGWEPRSRTITLSEIQEGERPVDFRRQVQAMRPVRHVYLVHEVPRPEGVKQLPHRIFAAVYVGREQA